MLSSQAWDCLPSSIGFVVQIFPRLLELGPLHFKAALHRLMMPLPSSGEPFQLAHALPIQPKLSHTLLAKCCSETCCLYGEASACICSCTETRHLATADCTQEDCALICHHLSLLPLVCSLQLPGSRFLCTSSKRVPSHGAVACLHCNMDMSEQQNTLLCFCQGAWASILRHGYAGGVVGGFLGC